MQTSKISILSALLAGSLGVLFASNSLHGSAQTFSAAGASPSGGMYAASTPDRRDLFARAIIESWDNHDSASPSVKHGPFLVDLTDSLATGSLTANLETATSHTFRVQNLGDTDVEFRTGGGTSLAVVPAGTGMLVANQGGISPGNLEFAGQGNGSNVFFVLVMQ